MPRAKKQKEQVTVVESPPEVPSTPAITEPEGLAMMAASHSETTPPTSVSEKARAGEESGYGSQTEESGTSALSNNVAPQQRDEPTSVADHSSIAPRGQFRSWVVDEELGYSRLTDVNSNLLLLQFADKPPADVLTAVKGAGFQFKTDHHGQRNVWVRRNDFEGRLQVESIEKLLRSLSPQCESVGF